VISLPIDLSALIEGHPGVKEDWQKNPVFTHNKDPEGHNWEAWMCLHVFNG